MCGMWEGGIRTWGLGPWDEGAIHPGRRQGVQGSRLSGKGLHSPSGHGSEVSVRPVSPRGTWHLNVRSVEGLSIQASI